MLLFCWESRWIVKIGIDIVNSCLREFTDAAPKPEVLDKIKSCIRNVDGVIQMHDLRVRTSGGRFQMETHIVVNGQLTVTQGHRIAKLVESCLFETINDLDRVIVHVDPETNDDMS
jgi:divalent metal cation (Fe/Co/Zn/Cd) transporter